MSLKAKVEAIIYATEEPVTLNELASLLKDAVLAELQAEEVARLALNETISDGPPAAEDQEEEELFLEEASSGEMPEGTEPERASLPVADRSAATDSAAVEEAVAAASVQAKSVLAGKDKRTAEEKEQLKTVKARLSTMIDELVADYASSERGMEIRQIAGGYRMATKPEHHDAVMNFAKSLKPPVRLSLQALETLAVIAYKQPVTVPEISEIRGVDSAGVIATLLDRKLITTSGRKQVIGRPILYKTTKEFLMRFGLNDVTELPSVEEFEKLGDPQTDLFSASQEASTASPEDEAVTEAVPEPGSHLMGETSVPAEGVFETEAEAPMQVSAVEASAEQRAQSGEPVDSPDEPVTEAVPEPGHHLVGETTMPVDGVRATEAEPEKP